MALIGSWFIYAVIAAAGLGGYMVFAKLGGEKLSPVIFASAMYTTGFVAMIPIFLIHMRGKGVEYLTSQPLMPLVFAGMCGISVIFTDTSIAAMFGRGAPVGIGMLIIQIMSLILAMLIGVYFFTEKMNLVNIGGVVLGFVALGMLLYQTKT